nr:calcium-activated chloride channel regulator 4A isoform X2 [Parasteatoda tepidariorum]
MLIFLKIVLVFYVLRLSCAIIKIDSDGGYTNVVVGFHPDVPNSKVDSLFIELEELFKTASRNLREASKGNLYFKEVIFAVPKKYHDATKFRNWENGDHYFRQPDIRITSNDIFQKAYTIQNDGCGKPGLRIHIPDEFIFKEGNSKGKDLLRAWAKYRYGIFDESGYVGDDLYPACYTIPGTNTTKVTQCTNKESSYDIRDIEMGSSKKCNVVPKYGKNNGITSSLMTNMDFPNIKFFCDDSSAHPHNKDVPSKQNILCKEQSTWKIISQHDDFKAKRKPSISEKTSFKYVMESTEKLIFAVETSLEMASDDRLDMVRNAFSYFMLYNLPERVTVGLTHLKNAEDRTLLLTVNSQTDAERLIDAFPEPDEKDDVCVHCGIEKALQILKNNSDVPHGDIVIATAKDIEEPYVKNLIEEFSNNFVNLHIIYFNRKLKQPPLLQKLVSNGRGHFYYISENYKSGSSGSSLTQVYEVFRAVYESLSWMNRKHVLVNHGTFLAEDCSVCHMTFSSDESLNNFQVLLTGPDFLRTSPIVKNTVNLVSQNESYSPGDPPFSYKIKIPAYTFKIDKPQPGMWSISFERKAKSKKPIVVIVRGFTSNFNHVIGLKTWIKHDSGENDIMLKQPPFTLYSEAKKGNFVINNATVTVTLHEVSTGTQITFPLFDNGDGDPDITKRDGIFSRYLINTPNVGYYIVTTKLEAESYLVGDKWNSQEMKPSYCCGSAYPSSTLYESKPLIRVVTLGSIFINERNFRISLPPRRITDLRVELVYLENGITGFALKWTSPGDNYDDGTAQEYQLRVFKSKEDAQKNFGSAYIAKLNEWNIHGSILIPHKSGTAENVIVELKNLTTGIYFLALRSVSSSGKNSEVSNVLEVFHTEPIITPTSIISTTDDSGRPTGDDSEPQTVLLAVTITFGILFILLILGLVLIIYTRRRRKREEQNEVELNKRKSESNNALCNGKDGQNPSAISPVNSWPADSLLSHYESQRCKKPDVCNVPMVHKDSEDSISTVSSKYSYGLKYHTNPSFYESSYFPNPEREEINYPFNPTYDQFHPTYTSSLRRFPRHDGDSNMFTPVALGHASSLDGRPSHRLRTDV